MNKAPKDEYIFKEDENVSVAEAKSNFSEYISRAAFANEKIVITKRGRPIAAIVSVEDMKKLKQGECNKGLQDAIGKWQDFDDIEKQVKKIYGTRNKEKGRDVSF